MPFERADPDAFFLAGFESASHRRADGVRLDLLRATGHDTFARSDYRACRAHGLTTVRDALRWHRIEHRPGAYDWGGWTAMLEAAAEAGVHVVWTLYHYGSPDHLDQRAPDFPDRFAEFAARAAEVHRAAIGRAPDFCPVNEISFFAWAVGKRYFPLPGPGTAAAFKRQLVRCAVAGAEAVRALEPEARFLWSEPLIHIAPRVPRSDERRRAEARRLAQFEAYDLLSGRLEPELGGRPDLIDLVGLNYYPHNQWYLAGATIPLGHHEYRPLADLLVEAATRYGKPILLAETGAEGSARPAWLHYVSAEARAAMARGADLRGICLFPITAYPGWDNGRIAETGLFSQPSPEGARRLFAPLAEEIARQRDLFGAAMRA